MHHYELRYTRYGSVERRLYSFEADCLGGALEVARRNLKIESGHLYEDGRPVCFLELVNGTGVWLVGAPTIVDEDRLPSA